MAIKQIPYARKIDASKVVEALNGLKSPNKLPATAIENAVLSVNGLTGHVTISDNGEVFHQVNSDWSANEGAAQILNKPKIFSGLYKDLVDKPNLFSGKYSDLTGIPALSASATSGSYTDLKDKPNLFDGNYNSLINKPDIPVVNYPMTSVNSKVGAVKLSPGDIGAANINHTHTMQEVVDLMDTLASKMDNGSLVPWDKVSGKPFIPSDTKDLINGAGFITASSLPEVPVQSVNTKTGKITLTYSDVGAASTLHTHEMDQVNGLLAALALKQNSSDQIPYSRISGSPMIPAAQVNADWSSSNGVSQILNKPTIPTNNNQLINGSGFVTLTQASQGAPVQSVNGKTGTVTVTLADLGGAASSSVPTKLSQLTNDSGYLTSVPVTSVNMKTGALTLNYSDVGAANATHTHPMSEVTGLLDSLNSKLDKTGTLPYSQITGTPTIPSKVSQLTNDSGFLTTAPVTTVNSKTGNVSLSATDVGAAPLNQGTRYYRSTGTQATGVKVKYYTVTSDASGAWTLNLGADFSEIFDVQAQAVSTTGVTGIRQSTVNAFTSTSTTVTGMTWGNTLIVSILLSGTNSLSLTPNTPVRIRVEGIGA